MLNNCVDIHEAARMGPVIPVIAVHARFRLRAASIVSLAKSEP